MPMKTIAGTNRHDAFSDTRATTPHTIHAHDTARRKPGDEGRRPGWTGPSGAGREPVAGRGDRGAPDVRGWPFDGLRPLDFGMPGTLVAVGACGDVA